MHFRNRIILVFAAATTLLVNSCKQSNTLFEQLSSSTTHITFENKLEKKKLFNILYYLYYYNGGGVATGDINNDGLPDIYFSANSKGHNKLYLNKGNFEFEDITEKAGVAGTADWCTGVSMADVNGDGLLDIYVSAVSAKYGLTGHNELFINNGNSTFTEKSKEYGIDFTGFSTQAAFFDFDHDGDLDCFILNQSHHPHQNIVDTIKRRIYDSLSGDRLYRNDLNTANKFTDVSKEAGIFQSNLGYGLGISIGDLNNDGWDDIYIGNDFHENDYYYVNNKNGTFSEEGAKHFRHYSRFSMGNDIADYNNDGQLDVVTVDMLPPDEKTLKTYGSDENFDIYRVKLEMNGYQNQYSKNCLQRNNGNGVSFSDIGLMAGVSATDWSWSPLFADFDNDGNKDLFVSSGIVKRPVDLDYVKYVSDLKMRGMDRTDKYDDSAINAMPDGRSRPFLFKGDGKYSFKEVSDEWGTGNMKGYYNGAAYADLDNDGNLDLVINSLNAPSVILKNKAPKKNYLSLRFQDAPGNKFGVGAKAYLFTKKGMQYQQLMLTRGFESSSDTRLHFGLDSIASVDSMLIVWPNQQYQVLKDVKPNQQLIVSYKNSSGAFDYATFFKKNDEQLVDISAEVNCKWSHKENEYVDFNRQYLLPHKESTRGPKIAVGDVNKDGLEDFYVCGAKFQPGVLMIQLQNGTFVSSDTALFNRFGICEDVDAKFFDANGDGFLDLWVVSGGNEIPVNEIALADRLYINDGTGHFSLAHSNSFTQLYENKSCIAVADVDKDGDNDVFIGELSTIFGSGMPLYSFLYMNDGKGKFTTANDDVMKLSNVGMITCATFTDVNNDSWPDLVVAGEWMPVTIFINNHGKFTTQAIPNSTGLWQTVQMADVNGDGLMDILAGNWGHNSKLWAGKDGPCKLYIKDFDNNGFFEQIMCYTIKGKEYTFLAKDELERALPVLKKAYLQYGEVAGKTVQYMFYDLFKDYKELKAETLSSTCFINNGKGGYTAVELPDELQLAPVMAFAPYEKGGTGTFIAAGNFYGVIPYEGRYDAMLPTVFSYDKNRNVFVERANLPAEIGEWRDAKWVQGADGSKTLILARNNSSLVFLK